MELLPCPFCGGAAELDYSRSFRAMTSGNIEQAVAIYCLECSADMTLCRSDHREYDAEQLADILTENWNRRALTASRSGETGWRLVPIEPTKAMVQAAIWSLARAKERDGKLQDPRPYKPGEKHVIRWLAMLAAAPIPTQEPKP